MPRSILTMIERDRTISGSIGIVTEPDDVRVRRDVTRSRCPQTREGPNVTGVDPIVAMLCPLSSCLGEHTSPRRGTIATASCGLTGLSRVRVVFTASSSGKSTWDVSIFPGGGPGRDVQPIGRTSMN